MGGYFSKQNNNNATCLVNCYSILEEDEWNLDDLKKVLEKDSSSINDVNENRETLLMCWFKRENCTIEDINVLLEFGADVNCKDLKDRNSLCIALECSKKEDIIEALLGKGDNDNDSTSLCLALHCGASKGVIELLLDAGYSESACLKHGSVLLCAVDSLYSGLKQDVFHLLIDRGADVNAQVSIEGPNGLELEKQTVMCYALQNGNEASTIQLLMDAGANINDCPNHNFPLLCATSRFKYGLPLQVDVVQLLIRSGASVDVRYSNITTPLYYALGCCKYDMEAIRLLSGCLSSTEPEEKFWYLFYAMVNAYCQPGVVKLLIEHGVDINTLDLRKENILHTALTGCIRDKSVIKALLENGVDVNQVNYRGDTPLMFAIKSMRDADILEKLLAAGAFINFCMCHCSVSRLLKEKAFDHIKVLLRYFFLQHSFFDIECMFQQGQHNATLLEFQDKCKEELQKMKSKQIGEDFSLYEFVNDYATPQVNSVALKFPEKKIHFDKLLKAIAHNAYPLYFRVISAKVGEKSMDKMLEEVQFYTVTFSLDNSHEGKKKYLNYEIMCNIAKFLAGDDLLRLILAFHNPDDHPCTGQASNKNNSYKRKAEINIQCCKRLKGHSGNNGLTFGQIKAYILGFFLS